MRNVAEPYESGSAQTFELLLCGHPGNRVSLSSANAILHVFRECLRWTLNCETSSTDGQFHETELHGGIDGYMVICFCCA